MQVTFTHGPDREPFALTAGGEVRCDAGVPFHGIISQGMLHRLRAQPPADDAWTSRAHRLHDASDADTDATLAALRDAARGCGALTFAQSAAAARAYVEAYVAEASDEPRVCELWGIKEGRTSSVWFCGLDDATGAGECFVVNVARDRDAGRELEETSRVLADVAGRDPALPVARVLDVASVTVPGHEATTAITVTRNELVPGALELHPLPGDAPRYAAVERFVTEAEAPGRIQSIRGRSLTDAECRMVAGDLAAVTATAAEVGDVVVDVACGDAVWDGRRARVVAVHPTAVGAE